MRLLALIGLAVSAAAADAPVVRQPGEIDWKVTGSLPANQAGSHEYHLIRENKATGGFIALVKFDKSFGLPAHRHTPDETLVVTKGKLVVGLEGGEKTLGPGAYAVIPGGAVHTLKAKGRCEFVLHVSSTFDFIEAPKK